jgi:hypothetical protein
MSKVALTPPGNVSRRGPYAETVADGCGAGAGIGAAETGGVEMGGVEIGGRRKGSTGPGGTGSKDGVSRRTASGAPDWADVWASAVAAGSAKLPVRPNARIALK